MRWGEANQPQEETEGGGLWPQPRRAPQSWASSTGTLLSPHTTHWPAGLDAVTSAWHSGQWKTSVIRANDAFGHMLRKGALGV